jgi:hypothetical protein
MYVCMYVHKSLSHITIELEKYCHVPRMGSVTNNTTWVRIGYRIYSPWRFTTATAATQVIISNC